MKIHDDHEVEEPEKITRFVCGALLGAVTGLVLVYAYGISSFGGGLLAFLIPMVGFGLVALYYGDRFWHEFIDWLSW